MADCRDVLNRLFPSGEVVSIIALSGRLRKRAAVPAALTVLKGPQPGVKAPEASRRVRVPCSTNGPMVHNDDLDQAVPCAAAGG